MKPFAPILVLAILVLSLGMPLLAQVAARPASEPVPISVGMRVGDTLSTYDDGGRRDPFTSLVQPKRTAAPGAKARLRPGLGSMALADVAVRGIIRSGKVMFAILEVPGKQSYVAHAKDKLLDATVDSIDENGVVFMAEDGAGTPAGKVRKDLRSVDDAGEELR
jgi:hypothetical protein